MNQRATLLAMTLIAFGCSGPKNGRTDVDAADTAADPAAEGQDVDVPVDPASDAPLDEPAEAQDAPDATDVPADPPAEPMPDAMGCPGLAACPSAKGCGPTLRTPCCCGDTPFFPSPSQTCCCGYGIVPGKFLTCTIR